MANRPASDSPPAAGIPDTRPSQATPPPVDPAPIVMQPGQRPLPEYEMVRRLGRGGFGEVWQAKGPGLPVFGVWQRDAYLILAMELAVTAILALLAVLLLVWHAGQRTRTAISTQRGTVPSTIPKGRIPPASSKKNDVPPAAPKKVDVPPQEPKDITVDLGNGVTMELVHIPAGTFRMGSPKDEEGRYDDEEQHEVEITQPFYLGKYTVTRGQFRRFVEATGYQTEAEKDRRGGWGYVRDTKKFVGREPKYTWKNVGFEQTDDHPVVNVTWNDAQAFCDWLNQKEAAKKFRLPTEAEWEYSCRAKTTTRFYSGDQERSLRKVANVADASFKAKYPGAVWAAAWNDGHSFTAPVGQSQPNAFGLYDMHGNVWQWCQDKYDKDYYKNSPWQDPQGPASAGPFRVFRGSSFYHGPHGCRSAIRSRHEALYRIYDLGFRVARVQ